MGLIAQIGRPWRAVLLVLAGAVVGGAAFAAADVPDTNGVIHACYQLSDPNQPPNQTPGNIKVDQAGNLYLSDREHNVIYKLTLQWKPR